jgi:hypothetical protein
VKDELPNVTFHLDRSFAGSISVNNRQHPNNTLFFWAFEKEWGSLTASAHDRCNESWIIWLQGGPGVSRYVRWPVTNVTLLTGTSSLYSLFFEVDGFI